MANKLTRMINGNVIEKMDERFEVVDGDNRQLQLMVTSAVQYITEVHGYMQRLESQLEVMRSKVEDIAETTVETNAVVIDMKMKNHIGKKPEFLQHAQDEVKMLTTKEIRQLVNRAANRQQKGYTMLYSKLSEITGIDIYAVGKTKITKADGLAFVNGVPTYMNTLFKKGVQYDAAAIALDILRNK